MDSRSRFYWTFAITSLALFAFALDRLVVAVALPAIRRDLGAQVSGLEWAVNAYTLSFAVLLLTGAALGDRFGRRWMFTAGVAVFTAGSAACCLRADDRHARGGPRGPGGGRRALRAADADDARRRYAARASRHGTRGVGRYRRPRRGRRPSGGRRPRRQRRLACHLLAERTGWAGADDRGPAAARGDPRPAAEPGSRGRGTGQRRTVGGGLGGDPGRRRGVGGPRGLARPRWRHDAAGAVRSLGDADAGPDAAHALLPPPGIRGRRAGLAADVRRAIRRPVPDHPAAAGRAGRQPAASRPAHAADGRHAHAAGAGLEGSSRTGLASVR